ncbi:hypothetical protein L1987_04870 [Smallanthus sonchifolius]|uniref:Uncharacterized protein n=1 Tax=Smallanthus sonchifolius TaxID=185202 RepID=A0ACB9JTS4_9ASTR|nr:hypothetical protein L1987_04870 [Smallanthus sonchifolius]
MTKPPHHAPRPVKLLEPPSHALDHASGSGVSRPFTGHVPTHPIHDGQDQIMKPTYHLPSFFSFLFSLPTTSTPNTPPVIHTHHLLLYITFPLRHPITQQSQIQFTHIECESSV